MFPGVDKPIDCPAGTYSNAEGLASVDQCLNCTGGEFCNRTAMTVTSGPCLPGYFCPRRSTSSREVECPAGHFCTSGTFHPYLCPSGRYSNGTGLKSATECTKCRAGWFCDDKGMTSPKGKCDPGYFCPEGQNVSNAFPCPVGKHCPEGSPEPSDCPEGTFAERPIQSQCDECPAGFYCVPELVTPGRDSSFFV